MRLAAGIIQKHSKHCHVYYTRNLRECAARRMYLLQWRLPYSYALCLSTASCLCGGSAGCPMSCRATHVGTAWHANTNARAWYTCCHLAPAAACQPSATQSISRRRCGYCACLSSLLQLLLSQPQKLQRPLLEALDAAILLATMLPGGLGACCAVALPMFPAACCCRAVA